MNPRLANLLGFAARAARRIQRPPTPPRWTAGCAAALSAALTIVTLVTLEAPAHAQRVNGTIQGAIVRGGERQPGAKVTATNLTNGAAVTVTAGPDGRYVLVGLAPGQYLLAATGPSGDEITEIIDLGTGQTLESTLDVASVSIQGAERIEVTGKRFDTRTSEVATDVSKVQLDNLPQNDRNFLNFAVLAPGIRPSTDDLKRTVSSGGLGAPTTNVFIDGLSLKNNINDGGVVGQDSSRGNPFPLLAVAGFRVLTQNYKAEYEQAGSSIISAVTRSGGNDMHAELYGSYSDRNISSIDPFTEKLMLPKPAYRRYQVGGLLSGPIIKNRLFWLATYEGNYQNRAYDVSLGNASAENVARFGKYQGSFVSPYRGHLGFGKLTWLPDAANTVDLSLDLKRETDVRTFGGQNSFENAENVRNNIFTTTLRHQRRFANGFVNEANAQFLLSQFNPGAENPDLVGREYVGVIKLGGRDTDQDIQQRTIALRNDLSFPVIHAGGDHQFKVGAKLALQHYGVNKSQFGNPQFHFRNDPANNLDFEVPFEAQYGVGNPDVDSNNTQIGLYAQDDWQIDRLTLNLGVRWDIETNPLNNDWVTPDDVRAAVTELATTVAARNGADFFRVNNYLTDGNQRPIYWGEIQPRLGVSYDILGNQKTVAFGGAGRYYDRTLYNSGLDERYRLQYQVRTFRFSRDGAMRDGQPTIAWNPSYLSRAGLQGLIDSGTAPGPEIFLLENDTKPLHTDQLSAGVRQQLGPVNVTGTFSYIRGENGIGFYPANRDKTGNRDFLPVPGGFGNVLISDDDIQSRFTGFYLTVEKPYTDESKWGATATYTLGWSKIRGDTFNFDFPSIKDTPMTPGNDDERQRLVVSGIVKLPEDFKLSTLITLGTGTPYNIIDASKGFGADQVYRRNAGRADDFLEYKTVDLRLTKELTVAKGQHATAFVEVFNLFNSYNYGDYDGFLPPTDADPNMNYGMPRKIITLPRSFQLGLSYGF